MVDPVLVFPGASSSIVTETRYTAVHRSNSMVEAVLVDNDDKRMLVPSARKLYLGTMFNISADVV